MRSISARFPVEIKILESVIQKNNSPNCANGGILWMVRGETSEGDDRGLPPTSPLNSLPKCRQFKTELLRTEVNCQTAFNSLFF